MSITVKEVENLTAELINDSLLNAKIDQQQGALYCYHNQKKYTFLF